MNFKLSIALISMLLLSGCNLLDLVDPKSRTLAVLDMSNVELSEDEYLRSDVFSLIEDSTSISGHFEIKFKLITWTEDYGLELFVLKDSEFTKYKNRRGFTAKLIETIIKPGTYNYSTDEYTGGSYRIVVDNTNLGREATDTDGFDDIATFDILVKLKD